MELWIRSQDKELLLKAICFEIDEEGKNQFLIITKIAQNYNNICVGLYKTKERALEVLDEIHQRLINIQIIELNGTDYITNSMKKNGIDCVYQMPRE